jgi:hypothetical protein
MNRAESERVLAAAQAAYDHSEPEDDDECGPCCSCDKKRWCKIYGEARIDAAEDERRY